jgi:hypothetical protein
LGATRALTALLAAACAVPGVAAPASHCAAGEATLFACAIGGKLLSVCTSAPPAAGNAVQYRFGAPGRIELALPAAGARDAVRGGVLAYSGGGGAYLAFANRDHRYVVYTGIGRGWGEKAGVIVERGGRRLASLRCSTEARSEIGPELFAAAGIAVDDPPRFELP